MKFKTTAIALAVAGSVAAPVAVQAGADELYASARVGLWNVDQGGESNLDVRSFSSRFGAKGETDLGNGLSGFGRYEWDVDFNGDQGEDDISVRHRYVGLKGDFGSVLLGQTYHTFYNFVVGPTDIPWWHSGYAMVNYRGRTDNAITYAGGTGAIAFGVSAYFTPDAEEEEPDQIEAGVSFGLGDMTLGLAIQNTADDTAHGSAGNDEDIIGAALSGISIGDTSLGFGVQAQDDDVSFLVDWVISNAYIHVESLSLDATDQDRLSITLGYTQSLGRKTTMYYEASQIDNDTSDSDDDRTALMAVLKYDII
jgi:predicted porin